VSALDLRPGSIFADEYRVVGLIGRGGMGAVYRVEHLPTAKLQALKVIATLGSQARARERFELEARIGAQVHSEHLVDVVAAGFTGPDEVPWLAMELLHGADLRALAKRHGRVPRGMVREVFYQLVQGLGAAHRAGVIHRDLKPENVFVSRSERPDEPFLVKVLDFGIAKLVHEGRAVTSATSTVGTPMWIAPEQLKRATLSVQTDVWALGLLVFWALTGRSYWEAANGDDVALEALLTEILMAPLLPASERAAALGVPRGVVPEVLDEWFERCVAREPELRYDNVAEAGRELDRALRFLRPDAGEPSSAEALGLVTDAMLASGPTIPSGGRLDETIVGVVMPTSVEGQVLSSDRFFRVELRRDGIVAVVRSAERSDDLEAFLRASEDVLAAVREAGELKGVLMDFRLAPPRNDTQFEDAMRPYRYFMGSSVGRVAFLVATVAGMLQMQRLGAMVDMPFHAFRSEDEALAYLRRGIEARSLADEGARG
jgi:serine/threonine protein kinase